MTIEQAIEQYDEYANVCEHHGLTESQEEFEQLAAWLRELQERRKAPEIRYLTDVEIASAVGARTISSANSWIYFARTMHELGLEVIERRTE